MSRYIANTDGVEVAYGYDGVLGYWIDVFEDGEIVIEESSMFTGLTAVGLYEMLLQAGVDVPLKHQRMLMIDLPI